MTRFLRHAARGAAALAVCAGFGWALGDVLTALNNHLDHIN